MCRVWHLGISVAQDLRCGVLWFFSLKTSGVLEKANVARDIYRPPSAQCLGLKSHINAAGFQIYLASSFPSMGTGANYVLAKSPLKSVQGWVITFPFHENVNSYQLSKIRCRFRLYRVLWKNTFGSSLFYRPNSTKDDINQSCPNTFGVIRSYRKKSIYTYQIVMDMLWPFHQLLQLNFDRH